MIDPKSFGAVSPLGLASIIITSVLAPATGWLIRNGTKLLKKYTILDGKYRDARKDIDRLSTQFTEECRTSDRRLGKLEDAIIDIRAATQRSDEQYAAISLKLELLPRVTTMLENFAVAIGNIVPRAEVDARLSSAEHRLQLVEQDVRKGGRA